MNLALAVHIFQKLACGTSRCTCVLHVPWYMFTGGVIFTFQNKESIREKKFDFSFQFSGFQIFIFCFFFNFFCNFKRFQLFFFFSFFLLLLLFYSISFNVFRIISKL